MAKPFIAVTREDAGQHQWAEACKAAGTGADAIVVSNHAGRQLDGARLRKSTGAF
jgi:isopentenyl diphosphate isomerase/L-lactate dehydrogenase-like FMN-dependent dehydrogenase